MLAVAWYAVVFALLGISPSSAQYKVTVPEVTRPYTAPTVPSQSLAPSLSPSPTAPSLSPSTGALTSPDLPAPNTELPAAPRAEPDTVQVVPPPSGPDEGSSLEAKCQCTDEVTGEVKCEISCCDKEDHTYCVEPK